MSAIEIRRVDESHEYTVTDSGGAAPAYLRYVVSQDGQAIARRATEQEAEAVVQAAQADATYYAVFFDGVQSHSHRYGSEQAAREHLAQTDIEATQAAEWRQQQAAPRAPTPAPLHTCGRCGEIDPSRFGDADPSGLCDDCGA